MDGRVLVVDDDLDILMFVRVVLEGEGLEVRTVDSGALAVELLTSEDWDVVLSDLHMPGIDGHGVLEAVHDYSPDTIAVIVTSDAQVSAAVETLRAGAFHFLQKPVEIHDLVAVVAAALETRRLRAASSLYQATAAVFGTLDARDLPQVIVEVALEVMGADHAVILVHAPEGYELRYQASEPPGVEDELPITAYQALARVVAHNLTPLRLPADQAEGLMPGLNAVAWPLVTRNVSYGVLVVRRNAARRVFGHRDMERASILAAQVSLALDNSALVSDLRDRVEALEGARRRLTTAERLDGLARFATGVAHELHSPAAYLETNLRALKLHLETFAPLAELPVADSTWDRCREGELAEVVREAHVRLGYALDGASRVALLAGDLSRISRSRDDVRFDLGQAVSAALRMASGRVREAVEVELEEATLRGNPGQLSSALINLLVNAEQALAECPDESIYLRSSVADGVVRLEVEDHGVGIEESALSRVTEPFYTTAPTQASTGLGLSLVREIVEAHGGSLDIRSATGSGTTVVVSLPVEADVEELLLRASEE